MKPNIKYFKIIDILHTGNHGPAGMSKRGMQYDKRRGKVFSLDMSSLIRGESLCFSPIIIWTTPFERFFYSDGYYHIVTLNSEYIVEEVQMYEKN